MTEQRTLDFKSLPFGHAIIGWNEENGGGESYAVIGGMHDGTRWYACANWTDKDNKRPMVAATDWTRVLYVDLCGSRELKKQPVRIEDDDMTSDYEEAKELQTELVQMAVRQTRIQTLKDALEIVWHKSEGDIDLAVYLLHEEITKS